MTTVPPPSTPLPQLPAAPPAATVVVILQPPPAVAAFPPGTVLEAVVIATPPLGPGAAAAEPPGKSNVVLRTVAGDVTLRLPVQLPDNARVALEILRTAAAQTVPQITVRVVTVDGQPAAQVLAQLARQGAESRPSPGQTQGVPAEQLPATSQNPLLRAAILPPGSAWTVIGPVNIAALGTISGFVTQGQAAPSLPIAGVAATSPGSPGPAGFPPPGFMPAPGGELSLRVTGVQVPGAASPPALPTTNSGAVPALSAPASPLAIGATAGQPLPVGAQGTSPLTVAPQPAFTPPGGANPPSLSPPVAASPNPPPPILAEQVSAAPGLRLPGPGGLGPAPPQPPMAVQTPPVLATLTGTVTSISPSGAPVIALDGALVQLNVRANLPIGTRVTLEVTAQLQPRSGVLGPAPTPAGALPLSGPPGAPASWPTLAEALAVLQRTDPQAAQQLAQALPDGGPRTAAALMSFAQAMRAGDARQWPGDANLRALERTGPRGAHLASQLSDEVAALSSRARETGAEWRALPVPWNAGGQIDRIILVTRREGEADDDKKKKGGGGIRFLINLDLSRLGSLQLDGMFRTPTKGFDLVIRTKTALPDTMRRELTDIFATSNAAMGLTGSLGFQVVKKFADPVGRSQPFSPDKSGVWA